MVKMGMGLFVLIFLICLPAHFVQGSDGEMQPVFESRPADFSKNCSWLESMVRLVKSGEKTYALVQSYENLDDRCWIYDQALAVICFTTLGRHELSSQILDTLGFIQNPDGSFYFSYKISTLEPTSDRKYTGSIAWVAMAVNLFQVFTRDTAYNAMLWKVMTWLCSQQVMDESRPDFGGVSLGVRNDAFSTEHNLDTYSAFAHYHNRYFRKRARMIKSFVLKHLYRNQEYPHFITGFNDPSLYLDCQSWAVLALGKAYCPVLPFAESHFQVKNGWINGQTGIQGFFERQAENSPVWSEGTEGMALAYAICGNPDQANHYHDQVKRMMAENGGVRYATENSFEFSTSPSIAGTAWHIFYELGLNPFRPTRESVKTVKKILKGNERFVQRPIISLISGAD